MPDADLPALGAQSVSGRLLRRRLHHPASRHPRSVRTRLLRIYETALIAAVAAAVAAGTLRPLWAAMTGPGWAPPTAPGRLFALAAVLLLLGGLARTLRTVGPIAADSAFQFWLLATPARRRDLLRPRFVALIAAITAAVGLLTAPIAHAASTNVLLAVALAAAGGLTVTAAAVWAQASQIVDHGLHVIGHALGAISALAFGSLATGIGRLTANAALKLPPAAMLALAAVMLLAAIVCAWGAYRALDRVGVATLSRGQAIWTSVRAVVISLDVSLLSEFLAEQRARAIGRVSSTRLGPRFPSALLHAELTRIRRRPDLLARAAAAALLWWGCRPVLADPALIAAALIIGYVTVLPMASTLRQLVSRPGLNRQFEPHHHALKGASAGVCLVIATLWTAVFLPGLPAMSPSVAVIIPLGLTAAVYRTATRPPLDYSMAPVGTPVGLIPVDLIRQLLRGPMLLAILVLGVILAH